MHFALDPVPHSAASRLIADKPAITRDIFNALPDELKARAYTIAGVEDADVLQSTQDLISRVPLGADWQAAKREIAAQISPWFSPAAALARAELLLSYHCRTAAATCQARIDEAQTDIFPYFIYLTNRGANVRPSHAALHGVIVPASSSFWHNHTPPWGFNCHCSRVPMTAEEAGEEKHRDSTRTQETRRVLDAAALTRLEAGTITRGPAMNVMLPRSIQNIKSGTIPYEELATRWDTAGRQAFETWADRIPMDNGGTLLSHINGQTTSKIQNSTSKISSRPSTFAEALARSGLDKQAAWSRTDIANLRASMRVPNPAQAADFISTITGAGKTGVLTQKEIHRALQDFLNILPRELADTLPKLDIGFVKRFTKVVRINGVDRLKPDPATLGDYLAKADGGPRLRLSTDALKGLKGEERRREMRRLLSHELTHWLHTEARGQAAVRYRSNIRSHYLSRTAAGAKEPDGKGGFYRHGRFYKKYVGREYKHEQGHPMGVEIPSTHFELWDAPETIMFHANRQHPDAASFRETFSLSHSILDSTP